MRPLDLYSIEFAQELLIALGVQQGAEPSLLYGDTKDAKRLRGIFNRKSLEMADAIASVSKGREIRTS